MFAHVVYSARSVSHGPVPGRLIFRPSSSSRPSVIVHRSFSSNIPNTNVIRRVWGFTAKSPRMPPPFKKIGESFFDKDGKSHFRLFEKAELQKMKAAAKERKPKKKKVNAFADLPAYNHMDFLPDGHDPPEVLFVNTIEEANAAIGRLTSPIGLDIEWTPSYRKGVSPSPTALVQLADNKLILLVHLVKMSRPPEELCKLLEDESFVKVGVGIRQDACKIDKDLGTSVQGVVDLNQISLKESNHSGPRSLAKFIGKLLGRSLSKPPSVVKSKWNNRRLSPEQISYAASDALSGLQAYHVLRQQALSGVLSKTWHLHTRDLEKVRIFDYETERILDRLPPVLGTSTPPAVGVNVDVPYGVGRAQSASISNDTDELVEEEDSEEEEISQAIREAEEEEAMEEDEFVREILHGDVDPEETSATFVKPEEVQSNVSTSTWPMTPATPEPVSKPQPRPESRFKSKSFTPSTDTRPSHSTLEMAPLQEWRTLPSSNGKSSLASVPMNVEKRTNHKNAGQAKRKPSEVRSGQLKIELEDMVEVAPEPKKPKIYRPGYSPTIADVVALNLFLKGATLAQIGRDSEVLRASQPRGGSANDVQYAWKPSTVQRRIIKALDMDRTVKLDSHQWARLTGNGILQDVRDVDDAMEIIEPLLQSRRMQGAI
ncbi:ribonuclease h-like protein [Phaffia rhodozyma]|uniref:3'-5' exonuclease n=1 Tax=Phaffia rhodozyma TaxID=264483 RepID=A0A0F7SSY4_PHARH|nr:ribonuclease h-like protein [Phaffia rhodozyma]